MRSEGFPFTIGVWGRVRDLSMRIEALNSLRTCVNRVSCSAVGPLALPEFSDVVHDVYPGALSCAPSERVSSASLA